MSGWDFQPPEGTPAPQPPLTPPSGTDGWERLDWRMMLIGPVEALKQFAFPAFIAIIGASRASGSFEWWFVPIALVSAVLIGLVPWLTTGYRFTDTQFQVRSGLLNKKLKTAPLDRVRSVDLESSLLHRVMGLAKVKVGTGVDDDRIELQALSTEAAADLRGRLLRRSAVTSAPIPTYDGEEDVTPPAPVIPEPQVLAEFDPSWVRFAPLSLSRLAVVAGAIGFLSQFADDLPFLSQDSMTAAWEWVTGFAIVLVVLTVALGALVGWLVISVSGYFIQWFGLRLARDQDNLTLTSGLFTTRSTTVEEARVRGVEFNEPLLVRLAGGADLATLSTGVGSGGITAVLPASPRDVDLRVGADILGDDEPLTVPLVPHGPAARRRCYVRALVPQALLVAAVTTAWWFLDLDWWIPVTVAVVATVAGAVGAATAYRNLGHALTRDHLVSGDGVFVRSRTVLERDGIIGWVASQNIFQRRVGLVTLVATTAAGSERVVVRDVPMARGVALADATTPGMVTPFLSSTHG